LITGFCEQNIGKKNNLKIASSFIQRFLYKEHKMANILGVISLKKCR
jgi:hypothetical protein